MPEATTLLGLLLGLPILTEAAGAFGVQDQECSPPPPQACLLAGGHRPAYPAAAVLGLRGFAKLRNATRRSSRCRSMV